MIKTFAEAERVLAQRLPGYTERPQQQRLAAFVEQVIADKGHGLAEAGCGTGKSLATMIPAILGGKRTIVATATKALMEQYANKDVPFLEENLGVPFTWALIKGRSNYFCRNKAAEADTNWVRSLPAILAEIDANPEHSGDFEHFGFDVPAMDKAALASTTDDCPGKRKCPFGEVCFAEKAKATAREAQVVITNTAMLMNDLKVRELSDGHARMLGDYDLVLIDEAHETENYATNALGHDLRKRGLENLIGDAANFLSAHGGSLKARDRAAQANAAIWDAVASEVKEDQTPLPLSFFIFNGDAFMDLIEALRDIVDEVDAVNLRGTDDRKASGHKERLISQATNAANALVIAATSPEEEYVRFVERSRDRRGDFRYNLKAQPIHVGDFLAAWLWGTTSAVLLSATLSVRGDFGFISRSLGLPETTQSLSVGTPFNYQKQAALFVPPASAPSPKDRSTWLGYAATMTQQMVLAAGGGALLLFTSRSAMENAYRSLAPVFEDQGYTCLIQTADANKKTLAATFQEDTNSILFGLSSFMTGVDFQGDACRLVVIDKLPFPVPTDPVFAARAKAVKKRGGNDFGELTIPMMTLVLEQAYGRLIRTAQDRGIVAILDSRLSSTGYGKGIVRTLPPSPVISTLSEVQEFFSS